MIHALLASRYLLWLWQGFGVTVGVSLCAALSSTLIGIVLALARQGRVRVLRAAGDAWVTSFRNTPLLVQLLFWYFGAATLLPDALMQWLNSPHAISTPLGALRWPSFEFVAAWLGLTCYTAAFIAAEFEAGSRAGARASARPRRRSGSRRGRAFATWCCRRPCVLRCRRCSGNT